MMNLFTPSYLIKSFLQPSAAKQIKRTTSSLLRAHSRNSLNRLLFESEHCNGGGHDDRSLSFRLMQLVVMLLRLVTPLSYLYLIYLCFYVNLHTIDNIVYDVFSQKYHLMGVLRILVFSTFTLWMIIEALFFPYYCYMFNKLNHKINHDLSHYGSTPQSRQRLVHECFAALQTAAPTNEETYHYIRKTIEGWFLDVPIQQIYRDNFHSWVSWAFFGRDLKSLSPRELRESEDYVRQIEILVSQKVHCDDGEF
jgi:hypothetical protein